MKNLQFSVLLTILIEITFNFKLNLIKWNENNYDQYKIVADKVTHEIRETLSSLAQELTKENKLSWCIVSSPKGKSSLIRKINLEIPYNSNGKKDFELVTDLARSSFVVTDLNDIERVYQNLISKYGNPKKDKDKFLKPSESGYRDRNLIFESKIGTITRDRNYPENKDLPVNYHLKFELQIHLCNIILAKEPDHLFYEITRILEKVGPISFNKVLSDSQTTVESFESLVKEANKLGKEICDKDYEPVLNAHDDWKKDRDNLAKITKFIHEIRNFTRDIYTKAMNDYQKEKRTCVMKSISNKDCKVDPIQLRNEGTSYLKRIWNQKKEKTLFKEFLNFLY